MSKRQEGKLSKSEYKILRDGYARMYIIIVLDQFFSDSESGKIIDRYKTLVSVIEHGQELSFEDYISLVNILGDNKLKGTLGSKQARDKVKETIKGDHSEEFFDEFFREIRKIAGYDD